MPTIHTIGHSTRAIEELVALLGENGVELVVDVRRYPGSRRFPHFNGPTLATSLGAAGIAYEHNEALGGRRAARPDSRNTAWRNESFRGYADYMETPAFGEALARLESRASSTPAALMCSEALWWRCHRALVSDALKARGWTVVHILGPRKTEEHPYTAAARVVDGKLLYRDQPELPL